MRLRRRRAITCEIFWKTFDIARNLLVEASRGDAVEGSKVLVEHDILTANQKNRPFDSLGGDKDCNGSLLLLSHALGFSPGFGELGNLKSQIVISSRLAPSLLF